MRMADDMFVHMWTPPKTAMNYNLISDYSILIKQHALINTIYVRIQVYDYL